jgi:ABC-2 type transport system permease protein
VIDQVRAEIIKIRSTRTTIGLILGMLVLTVSITLLSGLLQHARDLSRVEDQRQLLGIGSIAGLFAALAGILVVTSEYRFGTIRPTFLVTPSWRRILGAKIVASFVSGVAFGVVGIGLSYAIGYLCLSGRNIHFALDTRDSLLLIAGSIGGSALWGAIGVGVGTIIRNQVGSVIALLAWGFVVESLLFALVPSVGRWTPGEAQNAMQGSTADHLLSPGLGTLTMLVWLTVLAAVGVAWTSQRDVA